MGRKLEEHGEYWEFGQRLKIALSRKGWDGPGWTQAKIGKNLCGVTYSTINNWMNGHKLPSTKRAIKIAVILDVSLDWLLANRGNIDVTGIQEDIVYIGHMPTTAQNSIKGLVKSFDATPQASS